MHARTWTKVCAIAALLSATTATAAADVDTLPLRLSDLSPGYVVGDDSGCGLRFGDEGLADVLRELERDHDYAACGMDFERLWPRAGAPPLVQSEAYEFASVEGARAAFRARRALIAYVTGVRSRSLRRRPVSARFGDATAVYRTDDALVDGRAHRPGVIVLWRAGPVLALVLVAGRGDGHGEEALRLAGVQQARMAAPTPLAPSDNDDRQVPLEHPRLGLPVWWLGDEFAPPSPLPALVLEGASALGDGPGWRATVDYAATGGAGVTLGLWRPRAFARFQRTRFGRLIRGQRCARRTRIRLAGLRATIYGGYVDPPRRCDRRAPDRYLAVVVLDGAVITVNLPVCTLCGPTEPGDPYNTEAGMRAVVEELHPRPQ